MNQQYLTKLANALVNKKREKQAVSSSMLTKALSSGMQLFSEGKISWERLLSFVNKAGKRHSKVTKGFPLEPSPGLLNQRAVNLGGRVPHLSRASGPVNVKAQIEKMVKRYAREGRPSDKSLIVGGKSPFSQGSGGGRRVLRSGKGMEG